MNTYSLRVTYHNGAEFEGEGAAASAQQFADANHRMVVGMEGLVTSAEIHSERGFELEWDFGTGTWLDHKKPVRPTLFARLAKLLSR